MVHGKLASLAAGLHKPKMKWFVGPGGPVPLDPRLCPLHRHDPLAARFLRVSPDESQ